MDDALGVCGRERVGQRVGDVEHPLDRQAALGNGDVERLALDELHGEEVDALGFFDREDRDDARMIERGQGLRLAAESLQAVGVRGHPGGENLEGDLAPQLGVRGAIHLAHAAFAQLGEDAVVAEGPTDHRVPARASARAAVIR